MKELFRGVGPAMVTPFHESGEIDFEGLKKLTEHLISGGVDYLVVQGTTGESPTLSKEEKMRVLEVVAATNDKRLPIVFGIGGNNTSEVQKSLKEVDLSLVDGILSVSPFYNKPSQAGIIRHFNLLADASSRPIILYNVPPRTGSNLSVSTTIALSAHPNIIGIKEASGDLEQAMMISRETPDDFLLISGEDLLTVPLISIGAVGVISVLANGFPTEFSNMVHYAMDGNYERSREFLNRFLEINPLMYQEGNPVGIKAALKLKGVCDQFVRLPLEQASNVLSQQIGEEIKKAAL